MQRSEIRDSGPEKKEVALLKKNLMEQREEHEAEMKERMEATRESMRALEEEMEAFGVRMGKEKRAALGEMEESWEKRYYSFCSCFGFF